MEYEFDIDSDVCYLCFTRVVFSGAKFQPMLLSPFSFLFVIPLFYFFEIKDENFYFILLHDADTKNDMNTHCKS